jgi:hypothetical protein
MMDLLGALDYHYLVDCVRPSAAPALRHLPQQRASPGAACAPRRKRQPRRKFPACGTSELQRQARGAGLSNGATRSVVASVASRILIDVADGANARSTVGSLCLANMTVCRRTLRQYAAPRSTQGRTDQARFGLSFYAASAFGASADKPGRLQWSRWEHLPSPRKERAPASRECRSTR